MDVDEFTKLKELLRDAESCARLSQFEEEFLFDLRSRVLVHGARTRISERQQAVLNRIETKVYA